MEIVNKFCLYFTNLGPYLATEITSAASHNDYLFGNFPQSIFFNLATEHKVIDIASMFQWGKAASDDNISIYHMTRTAPRAPSLQNYWENPRMRAVRDGASRAGKSRPALLGSRTALREMRTNVLCSYLNPNFSAKMSDVSEHSNSEFYFPKKKKGKARWLYDKMLIDWVRSGLLLSQ